MSMIVSSLVNAALSYMSMHHFEEARRVLDYLIAHYWKSPETLFRQAQVIY